MEWKINSKPTSLAPRIWPSGCCRPCEAGRGSTGSGDEHRRRMASIFGYYNASKHALEAAFESLHHELRHSPLEVRIIEPGFTQPSSPHTEWKSAIGMIPITSPDSEGLAKRNRNRQHRNRSSVLASSFSMLAPESLGCDITLARWQVPCCGSAMAAREMVFEYRRKATNPSS